MDTLVGKRLQLYKLTDRDGYTMRDTNPTFWEVGTVHTKPSVNFPELCTDQVFHAFIDPIIAVLLSHTCVKFDINTMRLFEAEGVVVAEEWRWSKVGVFELKITKELTLPTKEELLTFIGGVNTCKCSLCIENLERLNTRENIPYSCVVAALELMLDSSPRKLVTPKELTV